MEKEEKREASFAEKSAQGDGKDTVRKDFESASTPETAGAAVAAKERAFTHINTRSFIIVVVMLFAILIFSAALSYFIPQGRFLIGADGNIDFSRFEQGEVRGIAVWRVITAPFRVFFSEDALTVIMISIFLLIMSGVFNIVEKTGGVRSVIKYTTYKLADKKRAILCIMVFIFMAFGSFFGMFEELVTLLPIIVVLALSLGFDTLTGLGMCMMAACFGFATAITNPFSVGLASQYAGTKISDGIWLRAVMFAIIFAMVCGFLLIHVRRISKNPQKSLTYMTDRLKLSSIGKTDEEFTVAEKDIFKTYAVFFICQLVILITVASVSAISGYAIPVLSVSFLVGGIVCGKRLGGNFKDTLRWLGQGMLSMLPAVVMIAIASSVKLVMYESGIMDTVLYNVIESLRGKSRFVSIILIYLLILFLQIFIGSATAKIILIMPIIFPVCTALGISPATVILTYCIADGFSDVILPTNPVLLIGLSMANVSYGKWFKFTWCFQLAVFAFTILVLLFAVGIGY